MLNKPDSCTCDLRGEDRDYGAEAMFEKIMNKNVLKLINVSNSHTEEFCKLQAG